MEVEYLKKIMKKCDVYFEDQLISGELLLQSFMDFLVDEAGRAENNGSIVLHLASPCFDAIAVAWAALTVIAGNEKDVESIIRNLRPGDKVLYDRKRAEFIGLNTDEDGVERVSIRYGGGTARIAGRASRRITVSRSVMTGAESDAGTVSGKNSWRRCLNAIKRTSLL